jgi:tetratricopeptide (TPR) repeat protein
LNNVLENNPNNIDALISLSSLKLIDKEFESAQQYADKVRELDPRNNQLDVLQSRIDFEKLRYEEEQLFTILNEGREFVIDGDCESALPYYEDYLAQADPNNVILKEYGDVLFCAGRYDEALYTYDDVLSYGYMYEASLNRAKLLYAMDDSLGAVNAFEELVKEEPLEFEPRMYLGDSYAKAAFYDSARAVYDTLLTWDLDSTETALVEQRIQWLPVKGVNAILATFPNYVGLAPAFNYYSDNISFRYSNFGARLELGVAQFLAIGASYFKHNLYGNRESLLDSILSIQQESGVFFTGRREFTSFKGHIFLTITDRFRAGAGFGTLNGPVGDSTPERDLFFRYENPDNFLFGANYINTDAALILYSPYLIDTRLRASFWGLDSYWQHKSGLRLSGHFDYIQVNDNNEGNNFWARIGRHFWDYIMAGYEYWYINWGYDSPYYYSPSNFESHSLWVDANLEERDYFNLFLGVKLGYIPANDFVLLTGELRGDYDLTERLTISGRLIAGSTSRDNTTYKYFSASFSAYWTIF